MQRTGDHAGTSDDGALPPRSTVLVTGVAGFIGSHLADTLLGLGHSVVGVDCFTDYYDPHLKRANLEAATDHDRFRFVEADLAATDLDQLLEEADAVCHLAGQPGVRRSWGSSFDSYLQHNLLASQRLLEALARKPRPTVFASSSSVYGRGTGDRTLEATSLRPVSPYGMTKASVEQLVDIYRRDCALPVVGLRYFTVFGPRQRPDMAFHRFIEAALDCGVIEVYGSGDQTRDFTFVDDAVNATIAAIGAHSPVYNVGGGSPASVNEVLSLISELIGRRLDVTRQPPARGDATHTWADTTLARTELRWQPRTRLGDGLAAQIASVEQRRHRRLLPV